MSDSANFAPQQYGPRWCRAICLVTIGATMHALLGFDTFGPPPAIQPLKVVHAAPRPASRPLLLERSTVFAPHVREPGAGSPPSQRGLAPAATMGIIRGD